MYPNPYQPPAGAGFQSDIPTMGGRYEFGHYENSVIDKLAGRVRWWGLLSVAFGGLTVLAILGVGLTAGAALTHAEGAVGLAVIGGTLAVALPLILIFLVTGLLYLGTGKALRQVVQTQGDDIEHLMIALAKFSKALRIEFWISLLGWIVGGLALVGLLVAVAVLGQV